MVTATLDAETALRVKEDIWNGMKHPDIQAKYGISYQMSVNIKAGRAYSYIPWPDGSNGHLGEIKKKELTSARRFGHMANKTYQETEVDNSTIGRLKRFGRYEEISKMCLEKTGKPIEQLLDEFNKVCLKVLDREAMAKHEAQMRALDEHKARMETDPAYAEAWINERNARDEAIARRNANQLPHDQIDPEANPKLSWTEVVELSEAKVVKIAAADEHEPSLRLAIQIVFKLLSPRQWAEDHCLRMIYDVKQKIERFWVANPDRAPMEEFKTEWFDEVDDEISEKTT